MIERFQTTGKGSTLAQLSSYNGGAGGHRVKETLCRYPPAFLESLLPAQGDATLAVFLLVGTNDVTEQCSLNNRQLADQLALLRNLRSVLPQAKIYATGLFFRLNIFDDSTAAIEASNQDIIKVVESTNATLPASQAVTFLPAPDIDVDCMMPDGVNLTSKGYAEWSSHLLRSPCNSVVDWLKM